MIESQVGFLASSALAVAGGLVCLLFTVEDVYRVVRRPDLPLLPNHRVQYHYRLSYVVVIDCTCIHRFHSMTLLQTLRLRLADLPRHDVDLVT